MGAYSVALAKLRVILSCQPVFHPIALATEPGQSGERKACGKGFGDIDFFCVEGETEKDGRGTEIKLCESF